MDHNIKFRGALFSSVILFCCAVLAVALGMPMLSEPQELWWIGSLLILCALFVGFSAVRIYRTAAKEKKSSDDRLASLDFKKSEAKDKTKVRILASWIYTVAEWKQFLRWEKKKTVSSTVLEAVIVLFLAALCIHYLIGLEWKIALSISIGAGIFYILIKHFIAFHSIRPDDNKMPEIIITNEAVIINGRTTRFYGNDLWLGKVTINDTGSFNVLEITYCLQTTKGETYDEIRIPIPKGSLKEAIFLQEKLMQEKVSSTSLKTGSN